MSILEEPKTRLWFEDFKLYWELFAKPWRFYRGHVPTRICVESAVLSTIFLYSLFLPLIPPLPGQKTLLWIVYNFVIYFLYGVALLLSGNKSSIKRVYKLLPLSYFPIVVGTLLWTILLVCLFLSLAGWLAAHNFPGGFMAFFEWFDRVYFALVAFLVLLQQFHILKNNTHISKWVIFSTIILAQFIGVLVGYSIYRLLLKALWVF